MLTQLFQSECGFSGSYPDQVYFFKGRTQIFLTGWIRIIFFSEGVGSGSSSTGSTTLIIGSPVKFWNPNASATGNSQQSCNGSIPIQNKMRPRRVQPDPDRKLTGIKKNPEPGIYGLVLFSRFYSQISMYLYSICISYELFKLYRMCVNNTQHRYIYIPFNGKGAYTQVSLLFSSINQSNYPEYCQRIIKFFNDRILWSKT